jgi:hypothetical protein
MPRCALDANLAESGSIGDSDDLAIADLRRRGPQHHRKVPRRSGTLAGATHRTARDRGDHARWLSRWK